jgi:hypothetical protein
VSPDEARLRGLKPAAARLPTAVAVLVPDRSVHGSGGSLRVSTFGDGQMLLSIASMP